MTARQTRAIRRRFRRRRRDDGVARQSSGQPEKTTTEKPKARAKKAQAEDASSDILDDPIPFEARTWPLSTLERRSQPAEKNSSACWARPFDGERLNALNMIQRMADDYKMPIHELLLAAGSGGQVQVSTDSGPNKRNAERAKLSFGRSEPNKQPGSATHPSCRT